jgi:hypothetical protein
MTHTRVLCFMLGTLVATVSSVFALTAPGRSCAGCGIVTTACGLYETNHTGSTLNLVLNTPVQWTTSTAGQSQGDCTLSVANDNATITRAGLYILAFGMSEIGAGNDTIDIAVFDAGVELPACSFDLTASNSNLRTGFRICLAALTATSVLDMRVTNRTSNDDVTLYHVSLNLHAVM